MAWKIEFSAVARKQLHALDRPVQKKIADYLKDRIEGCKSPRHFGEALSANRAGLWRYRVGDYRIICEIQEEEVVVLVLVIGHRREIYK